MGQAQAPGSPVLPKEYLLTLPSCGLQVALRKMTTRDSIIASKLFDQDKDSMRFGAETLRLCTLKPGSVSLEAPAGIPYFSMDSMQDLDLEDISYLGEASQKINKVGKYEQEYKFDF